MSFQPLSKIQKKEMARLAARGPTPEEVANDRRRTAEAQRKREVEAAYKALAADNRKPGKLEPAAQAALIGRLAVEGL